MSSFLDERTLLAGFKELLRDRGTFRLKVYFSLLHWAAFFFFQTFTSVYFEKPGLFGVIYRRASEVHASFETSKMKYVPFVAQVESWKKSFAADRHPGNKRRWLVNQRGGGQEDSLIQLVTPTQQAVERAQSEVKEMRKRGAPVPSFKPKVAKRVSKEKKQKRKKRGNSKKLPKF